MQCMTKLRKRCLTCKKFGFNNVDYCDVKNLETCWEPVAPRCVFCRYYPKHAKKRTKFEEYRDEDIRFPTSHCANGLMENTSRFDNFATRCRYFEWDWKLLLLHAQKLICQNSSHSNYCSEWTQVQKRCVFCRWYQHPGEHSPVGVRRSNVEYCKAKMIPEGWGDYDGWAEKCNYFEWRDDLLKTSIKTILIK